MFQGDSGRFWTPGALSPTSGSVHEVDRYVEIRATVCIFKLVKVIHIDFHLEK